MKRYRLIIKIFYILAIVFILIFGLYHLSKSRTFQFFGGLTNRIKTSQKVVALTFDDAPSTKTLEVLEILKQTNVKATFYVIGSQVDQYPDTAKAIVDAGMELGNHSYSHHRLILKSLSFIKSEITKTNDLIRSIGYTGDITFRPPNGKKLFILPWYLNKQNIKTVMWDIEPDTYFSDDTDAIVKYTLDHVQPGSIILLHPFCEINCLADRQALPLIIDSLQKSGYTFVTVSDLLEN